MTIDEFITLFQSGKIMVHVHNQREKAPVLDFLRASVFQHSQYNFTFDPDYQYVGIDDDLKDICCWRNYELQGADSIEYEEFCSIIYGQEDLVDEKSILSLL